MGRTFIKQAKWIL